MPSGTTSQLEAAMRQRQLVRFSRACEDGWMRGYVLGVGPKFFLLARVDDRVRFDGFECIRVSDARRLKPDPHTMFTESALKKRNEPVPSRPPIRLATIAELLSSANRSFPLVTIHRERVDPTVCHIGRVVRLGEKHVSLWEIGPDAVWEDRPTDYRLDEITRVSFGGGYEEALFLVGGKDARANCWSQLTAKALGGCELDETVKPAAEYLNVDLEIRSRSDLTPLVDALSQSLLHLQGARIRGTFLASFEVPGMTLPPDMAIKRLLAAVSALPPSAHKLWKEARDRVFDIGIEGSGGRHLFSLALETETLRAIAKVDARLAYSVYPPEKHTRQRLPKRQLHAAAATPDLLLAPPHVGRRR